MKSLNLRNVIYLLVTASSLTVVPVARADELATVYQYELRFGGSRPTSTFYLSYQNVDTGGGITSRAGVTSGPRLALYSTDAAMPTAFRMVSGAFQVVTDAPDATKASPAPVSASELLGGALAFAYVGASLARAYKEIVSATELDYGYSASGIEKPAPTQSKSPDSAHGK